MYIYIYVYITYRKEKKNFSLKTWYFIFFFLAVPFFPFLLYGQIFSRLVTVSHATGTWPLSTKM